MQSEFIPIMIVDNFFKDPDQIRKKALSFTYDQKENFPGVRTLPLDVIDNDLFHLISKKILSLFLDLNKSIFKYRIQMCFQYTTKHFEYGWAHHDTGMYCAGVIYLTPNPPKDSGTIIYNDLTVSLEDHAKLNDVKLDYYKNGIKHKDYDEIREKNNSMAEKSIVVENVYNRALIYPANYLHSQNNFFGESKEDARLICVFFVQEIAASSLFPIDRANQIDI